jgi:nucleotide-binding universal stress UspA family protein
MYRKIFVCTDGSNQALQAARLTADLASRLNASVVLVNVLDPIIAAGPASYVPEAGMAAEIALQCAQEGQQAVLHDTRQIFEQGQAPCQLCAELGHPVERIHEMAEQMDADLIVMGSRGLSAWPALLLGSVSEGMAQQAPCPVLIVRGEPKEFARIVMASDGSEGANHAVRAGMELAKVYHGDVDVLHVFQPLANFPGIAHDGVDADVYAARVKEAISGQVAPVAQEMGVSYQLNQEQGHPAETLVRFAEQRQADLIVVGSRGLGGFRRLLLGSVSTNVLRHAHCSILVVR